MKIDNFNGAKKIADIVKDDKNPNDLKLKYATTKIKKGKKITYAKVVNGEITHIFESSNFKSLSRYYKNHNTVKKKDKAIDSNFVKYPIAKMNLEQGNRVEIYELNGSRSECLKKYYKQEDCYPNENFQANNNNIPNDILQEYEKIKRERK